MGAACREVREETGITCKFHSILTFWHRYGLQWGTSDIYVVCRLDPVGGLALHPDPGEVSECCWMPIPEFLRTQDHPLILHVLRSIYRLSGDGAVEAAAGPLAPHVELPEEN